MVDFKKLLNKNKKPKVINIMQENLLKYTYIGRGSPWGNHFIIPQDGNRKEVIQKFINFYKKSRTKKAKYMRSHIQKLIGAHLGCYCTPLACHGDFLLLQANIKKEGK